MSDESPSAEVPNIDGKRVIFSICSRNYLHYARALIASLRSHAPDVTLLVILADQEGDDDFEDFVGTKVIPVSSLGIPTLFDMAMRYNVTEFNTSIKPYAFQWLFERGAASVIYCDPDTLFYREPIDIFSALDGEEMDAVVTPHITAPLDMDKRPTELRILQTGVYNLGFLALARSEATVAFLRWWASFMPADCRADLKAGIFVDQKYIDLLPSYVPQTKILRHPGYNVAYWNLVHRPLTMTQTGWLAGDAPLVFMHFSGVRADEDQTVSVHQDRLSYNDLGEGAALFDHYRQILREGSSVLESMGISLDYGFGRFTDGVRIEGPVRKLYAKTVPPRSISFEEAFDPLGPSYSGPSSDIPHEGRVLVSHVMYDLWRRKGHLKKTFDLKNPAQTEAFALWVATAGHQEWNIHKRHVPDAVWQRLAERRSWRFKLSQSYFVLAQQVKKISFLFPKPIRRFGVRLNRAILPRVMGRAK
ncbi:MAG: hypothetical protein AAFX52_14125 [Pseudomonadota bacterium]